MALLPRVGFWLAMCLCLAISLYVSQPPAIQVPATYVSSAPTTDVIEIAQGQITGVYSEDGAVEVYTGIPYAKPPVGDLRWCPPQPPESWEGVRACDHFGPIAMQPTNNVIFDSLTDMAIYHTFHVTTTDNYTPLRSEDCLYLNVWKPAGEVHDLPVLVYIHGGSLTTGWSFYNQYNGERMAHEGVVVVNMAYRLGVFGYLALDELERESGTCGNYGLLDQIAALEWVRENIAAFGGDPAQVTIAGESAGASSVCALCVSPLSEGLFQRAIAESSGLTAKVPYHTFRSLDDAKEAGQQVLEEFGADSIEALRAIPAEQLVQTSVAQSSMTVDGYAITEQPYLTYEKGENHEKALLNGFNAHEADLFTLFQKIDEDNCEEVLQQLYGPYAADAMALFPAREVDARYKYIVEAGGSAKGAFNDMVSAAWFSYSHHRWSEYMTAEDRACYLYYFTKDNGSLGSCHAGELPYAFGNLSYNHWLYDETDEALSDTMLSYWVNFVKTGDPNGAGLPNWPRYAEDPTSVLELGAHIDTVTDPYLGLYALHDAYQDTLSP